MFVIYTVLYFAFYSLFWFTSMSKEGGNLHFLETKGMIMMVPFISTAIS